MPKYDGARRRVDDYSIHLPDNRRMRRAKIQNKRRLLFGIFQRSVVHLFVHCSIPSAGAVGERGRRLHLKNLHGNQKIEKSRNRDRDTLKRYTHG